MRVGVLALQGGFVEHVHALNKLGSLPLRFVARKIYRLRLMP